MPSIKASLRIAIAALCICAAPAIAQDATGVTLKLNIAEAAEIVRLVNMQPSSQSPPPAYWDLQVDLNKALLADPKAMRAFQSLSAGSAVR
jgi:hypothetical protein